MIKDIVLALTYRCNSRCQMCSIWKMTNLPAELAVEAYGQLPASLTNVNLSGGEPFLRSELPEIVRTVKMTCPRARMVISTNGLAPALVKSKISEIMQIEPEIGVAVSVDGIGEAHALIRGIPGAYDRVLETLDVLKQAGVKHLKLSFTLGDYNPAELAKVYHLARQVGAEFSLTVVHSSANYFQQDNAVKLTPEMEQSLHWLIAQELRSWSPKRWARAYLAYGALYFLKHGQRLLPDYSGQLNIFIDPYGRIFPNDIATNEIGKLTIDKFEIYDSVQSDCPPSWMVCTARPGMKKHWVRVGWWMVLRKFRLYWA